MTLVRKTLYLYLYPQGMTTPAPTASARWTNKNQKGEFHAKLITVTCHKRHPARQTGSSAQLCDIRRMYFANSLVYWHWNSFITLALKLLRHVHSSDCICLVFWMGNWNSSPPIKFTLLVAATDHMTCGGSGRKKKQWKHLVQFTERRSCFSRRKCCWRIKLSSLNRRED